MPVTPSPFPHRVSHIPTAEERSPALRADAARNRERIVAAANAVFAERGLDASTAEIAHQAGVGEATLFRRFPTKDDLIVAIVQTQLEEVIALAEDCLEKEDPWRAIERFLSVMVERQLSDRGASDAAKDHCMLSPALDEPRRRIVELMNALVRRAQDAGVVRGDLNGQDLGFLMAAATAVGGVPFPGLRHDLWKRYLGVILDGIRPEGATRLRPGAPHRRLFERPEQ
jgi:AcrR family transcriptional regulator